MNLWNDLLTDQRVITREEVEYDIAMDGEVLDKREDLIWKLFDADPVIQYSAIDDLKSLYQNVVKMIEGRNYE